MAFSKTPEQSTYSTERASFATNLQQRSGSSTKDPKLVNMSVEMISGLTADSKKYFTKTRPGIVAVPAYATDTEATRGLYFWPVGTGLEGGWFISVVGNNVYSNGTSIYTLSSTEGAVGFTEYLNDVGESSLFMADGTNGYLFADGDTAPTVISGGDFPTPHVPQPIFLDGYIFLAKAGTQDVYNSNLNDPLTWTAGDFLSTEMFPDTIVGMTKNDNYIWVFGRTSIEYFYDAANATGTPLARQVNAAQARLGTVAPWSIVSTEKETLFIGQTGTGGYSVFAIEGFKDKDIGTPAVRSILFDEGPYLSEARAYCVRVSGQKYYVLSFFTSQITLVYNFETNLWSRWSSGVTGANRFVGVFGTDGDTGSPYVMGTTGPNVYRMGEDLFDDNGTAFLCEVITQEFDFDSYNRKTMSRLTVVGDTPDYNGTDNTIQVSWSDDDYNTWTTPVSIDLSADMPSIHQLGMFRRRAFKFQYSEPRLLRLEGFEMDINKGQQ
jgi:hypothetical protein